MPEHDANNSSGCPALPGKLEEPEVYLPDPGGFITNDVKSPAKSETNGLEFLGRFHINAKLYIVAVKLGRKRMDALEDPTLVPRRDVSIVDVGCEQREIFSDGRSAHPVAQQLATCNVGRNAARSLGATIRSTRIVWQKNRLQLHPIGSVHRQGQSNSRGPTRTKAPVSGSNTSVIPKSSAATAMSMAKNSAMSP